MPRPVNHRWYWSTFLFVIAALMYLIQTHVRGLDRQVRREGISSQTSLASLLVLKDMIDIETGFRGFGFGRKKDYLQPYHEGKGRLTASLARLRAKVADNPAEAALVADEERLIGLILAKFTAQIDAADADAFAGAAERFNADPTKPIMDQIRDKDGAIQAEQDHAMQVERYKLDSQMDLVVTLTVLSTWISFGMALAMATGLMQPPQWNHAVSPRPDDTGGIAPCPPS